MPAKLTLYPPRRVPRFLVVRDEESLEIGREPTSSLLLDDPRVSKRHALLRWLGNGWSLEDLGSKNGTKVNGANADGTVLADGAWISFGGLLARFERLTATQAARLDSERLTRLQTSVEMRRRLGGGLEPVDLMLRFLELAMEVAAAERGFVLVLDAEGKLSPEVAAGFSQEDLRDQRFEWSAGAVKEAMERGPVVVSDVPSDPGLGKRPSVVAQGLWSLACLPLCHDEQLLGVLYVDSRQPGLRFSVPDLEMLEILADHTAMVLAAALANRAGESRARLPEFGAVRQLRERLEELLPGLLGSTVPRSAS